jgi:hypothetical protein
MTHLAIFTPPVKSCSPDAKSHSLLAAAGVGAGPIEAIHIASLSGSIEMIADK